MRDARRYKQEEEVPWPVLVDNLEGMVHQVYGGLADPSFLIDAQGVVAYYNMWTYAPGLYRAIETLLGQGGLGVAGDGIDRLPHLAPAFVHGWRGIRRGLPQSYIDMELALPGSGVLLWLGYQLRGLFEPLVIRARPLPASTRAALWAAFAALVFLALRSRRGSSG